MKVVIAGAGFGGLKLARRLNNKPGFEVLLIDRFNFHQFQPLYYQVATAGLDASNISFPLRKMFHKSKNVRIRTTTITHINTTEKIVITEAGNYNYDVFVLATGADTNFFNNTNIEANSFPMKTTVEALRIRHRLIQNFEDALHSTNLDRLNELMTVVIVGGGPTGVELSGAIAEMKKYMLPQDYPDLDFKCMKIILVEGSPKTLASMSEKSSEQSLKYLTKLGVEVRTNLFVKDYTNSNVILSNGDTIKSEMVIWAAGIKGNVPNGIDKNLITKGNRLVVNRYNEVLVNTGFYAIGDVAYMETPKYPTGHPQVANVAIDMADNLADNLIRMERKSLGLYEYEYSDKGSMATVGRNLAVVDIPKPKLHFGGILAWIIWMGLHLFLLIGVKNRIMVFINWVVNYFTKDQSLRLIFKEFYKENKK